MNILILTAKFGLGHYKAAESLKEKIIKENKENNVVIIDFFECIFPDISKTIYKTFNALVTKCPTIYNLLNEMSPKNNAVPFKKKVVKKIEKLLKKINTDIIISVVPICSEYISEYIKITNSKIPLHTLITDIEVHNSWINDYTKKYFVPCLETKEYLKSKNIKENKIVISGLPVNSKFVIKEHKNHKKKILIMGGGLGLLPNIDKLLNILNNDTNIETKVILGSNKKLYNKLKKKYKRIDIIGYTNSVHKYMNEANLIISKSGCITLFEAIHTETPLYILKPFLIQEIGNAKYIEKNKIGKVEWENKCDIYLNIIKLLNNDKEINEMKKNMHKLKNRINNFNYSEHLEKVGEL